MKRSCSFHTFIKKYIFLSWLFSLDKLDKASCYNKEIILETTPAGRGRTADVSPGRGETPTSPQAQLVCGDTSQGLKSISGNEPQCYLPLTGICLIQDFFLVPLNTQFSHPCGFYKLVEVAHEMSQIFFWVEKQAVGPYVKYYLM